jgi:hypothetical protein
MAQEPSTLASAMACTSAPQQAINSFIHKTDQSRRSTHSIEFTGKLEEQATIETGYLKPEKNQLSMVTKSDVFEKPTNVDEVMSARKPFA